jgi:hypothetical protein
MNSTLKFDRVVLVKEINEKFRKVGETFEVASISDNGFLLREASSKVAVGVISFEDFERCFVKEGSIKGWTPWTPLTGLGGQKDAFYRTNGKKVQVRFITDKVRAEASCNNKIDEFNLYFGIEIAYLRCCSKVLEREAKEYEEKAKINRCEIADNDKFIENMLRKLRIG